MLRVTQALLHHQRRFIRFPTSDPDVLNQQVESMHMRGFPQVIGCIDGTHVHLHTVVLSSDEHVYVNRKGKQINLLLLTQNRQLRRRLSQQQRRSKQREAKTKMKVKDLVNEVQALTVVCFSHRSMLSKSKDAEF